MLLPLKFRLSKAQAPSKFVTSQPKNAGVTYMLVFLTEIAELFVHVKKNYITTLIIDAQLHN